jgi:hypothetical protein
MSLSPNFLGFVGRLGAVICCIGSGLLMVWFVCKVLKWTGVFS